MKFTLFAAFLFSIGWMSVALAVDGPPVPCCLIVSDTRIPAENIVKYDIQNKTLCHIKAVRFHTKKDKVICSDPDNNWAKKVMKIVDGRVTKKPSLKPVTCYTSTTSMIPTTATTDETSGTETETSTSTTVTPAVMTIKTSEMETSTSTTVPATVTTIKTSTLETEVSKTTILPTSMSTDNPASTVITCGTDEPASLPTETTHEMPGIGTATPLTTFTATDNTVIITTHHHTPKRTTLSKLIIKIRRKSKKGLRKFQMNLTKKSG